MRTEPLPSAPSAEAATRRAPSGLPPELSFRSRLALPSGRSPKAGLEPPGRAPGEPLARGLERLERFVLEDPEGLGKARARPRRREAEDEPVLAEPARFAAPLSVLSPAAAGAPAPAGSGAAQAELAALLERFLTSVRVGRLADGSPVMRMRVDGRGRADVDVELRASSGALTAVVGAVDGDRRRSAEWAERLEEALRARGLYVDAVEVG